jgi:Fe-S-cluster-containing hydrogenase component 2
LTKLLAIDLEKCTGCRNCELACSIKHTSTFNPGRSRIQILKDETKSIIIPVVCLHCENPLCQDACPNSAIQSDKLGTLYVQEDICIGCQNCVTACIYGGIEIDPLTRKAIKCDLCGGDPACVKACDYKAISYVDSDSGGLLERAKGIKVLSPIYDIETKEADK